MSVHNFVVRSASQGTIWHRERRSHSYYIYIWIFKFSLANKINNVVAKNEVFINSAFTYLEGGDMCNCLIPARWHEPPKCNFNHVMLYYSFKFKDIKLFTYFFVKLHEFSNILYYKNHANISTSYFDAFQVLD